MRFGVGSAGADRRSWAPLALGLLAGLIAGSSSAAQPANSLSIPLVRYAETSDGRDCRIFEAVTRHQGWDIAKVPQPIKLTVTPGSEFERFRRELRARPATAAAERTRWLLRQSDGLSPMEARALTRAWVARVSRIERDVVQRDFVVYAYSWICRWPDHGLNLKPLADTGLLELQFGKPEVDWLAVNRPVIVPSGTLALVETERVYGPWTAQGKVCVLRRKAAEWRVLGCTLTWTFANPDTLP